MYIVYKEPNYMTYHTASFSVLTSVTICTLNVKEKQTHSKLTSTLGPASAAFEKSPSLWRNPAQASHCFIIPKLQ